MLRTPDDLASVYIFPVNETRGTTLVDWRDLLPNQIFAMIDTRLAKENYPFSICVDGMANR